MNFVRRKIGARLGAAFGVVLLLMAGLVLIASTRLLHIGQISERVIEKDWVKFDAAATINALTRANAALTMELFTDPDAAATAAIYGQIDTNKKRITEAVDTLERLLYLPRGKALLQQLKTDRARYVASFGMVGKLIRSGQRDAALTTMRNETKPALLALQASVIGLTELQRSVVVASGAEIEHNVAAAQSWIVGLGCAALLVGIISAFLVTRSITRPLLAAVSVAKRVAAGDLSSHIEVTSSDETGQLMLALKEMNRALVAIVDNVRKGTVTIATASGQIAAGNLDLSSRTEQQASSLEETASTMEELTSAIRHNADNARQANQLAESASAVAQQGGSVVSQVVQTMGSINASSRKIVDIISVIDGIAFQTNILALNAAVEAARAGEQGRGFAVVASEVRSLAQRSASAAKEIKQLITDSVDKVDAGSRLVDQAGTTMGEIVSNIQRVSQIMGDISSANQEQSSGIEQVSNAIVHIDQVTQQNAALVEQSAAAAASMQEQATQLAELVSVFRLVAAPAARQGRLALGVG